MDEQSYDGKLVTEGVELACPRHGTYALKEGTLTKPNVSHPGVPDEQVPSVVCIAPVFGMDAASRHAGICGWIGEAPGMYYVREHDGHGGERTRYFASPTREESVKLHWSETEDVEPGTEQKGVISHPQDDPEKREEGGGWVWLDEVIRRSLRYLGTPSEMTDAHRPKGLTASQILRTEIAHRRPGGFESWVDSAERMEKRRLELIEAAKEEEKAKVNARLEERELDKERRFAERYGMSKETFVEKFDRLRSEGSVDAHLVVVEANEELSTSRLVSEVAVCLSCGQQFVVGDAERKKMWYPQGPDGEKLEGVRLMGGDGEGDIGESQELEFAEHYEEVEKDIGPDDQRWDWNEFGKGRGGGPVQKVWEPCGGWGLIVGGWK